MFHDPTAALSALRLTTAGSVDDGKSTLIGRLLLDAGAVSDDQLAALRQQAERRGRTEIDPSLLTDGLMAEREQGITIDVAYRYFTANGRKYILGDAPGHERYTRNMVTAASNADAAIVLLDAGKGLTRQTRRHFYITHLLGLRHVVVAVNKMDLVDYAEPAFLRLAAEMRHFAAAIGAPPPHCLPVSARHGDNVVRPSARMPWHDGPPLLALLEGFAAGAGEPEMEPFRFSVQLVHFEGDAGARARRVLLGSVLAGSIRHGEEVLVQPSGERTRIAAIDGFDGPLPEIRRPAPARLVVADDLDIGRGDLLAAAATPAQVATRFEARLCWFDERPHDPARRYLLRHGSRWVSARIARLVELFDLETGVQMPDPKGLGANDIARAAFLTQSALAFDPYRNGRATGAFILVDEQTNTTVAAGMIDG
ncbi:MAG: sulfate adenylyltransferase [Alphaproteobacteria bacterium]|nr:sulfate adenylyltransferase [Alphaproteobacteria bacterium]